MSQQELKTIIAMLQDFVWGETLAEMRENFEAGFTLPRHPIAQVTCVNANGVPAELIFHPPDNSDHLILYLHGGGFVMGSCQTHRRIAADLAETSGARVLCLDYRLAPEYPFPAGLEDSLTAYHWLLKEFQPQQIALVGDSAGGNLALTTLLSLRDAGKALPASTVLISPYCDQTRTSQTIVSHAERDPMVSSDMLNTITACYASNRDLRNPLISPLYADLSGLPPLLVHVGAAEVLLDDALKIVRQIGLSNGSVELKVWRDMIHCFHLFAPMLSEGHAAIAEVATFLNHHWPAS
ncbi:MAG: alpha/beta hydrolase [Cyanobacteria bacterium P01_D01_bin.44]